MLVVSLPSLEEEEEEKMLKRAIAMSLEKQEDKEREVAGGGLGSIKVLGSGEPLKKTEEYQRSPTKVDIQSENYSQFFR